MPERWERLRNAISELRTELESHSNVDAETRQALQEAIEELEVAVTEEQADELKHRSLRDRIVESVESFEASHPTLAAVLSRMADALGQLGI